MNAATSDAKETGQMIARLPAEMQKSVRRNSAIETQDETGAASGRPSRDGPYIWHWGIMGDDLNSKI